MKLLEVCLSTDYYQQETNNTNGVGAQSAHWEALIAWFKNHGEFIWRNELSSTGLVGYVAVRHPTTHVQISSWLKFGCLFSLLNDNDYSKFHNLD
jgi:hypothetical protein